jgi:PAS domain S-box-containing protein
MNILVVDDRGHRGRLLVERARPPAPVRPVAAVADALAASAAGPCVFVVPVVLTAGEAGGLATVRALARAGGPVLALAEDAGAMEAAAAAGADDVVSAAADPGELRVRLALLSRRRARTERPLPPAGLARLVGAVPAPAMVALPEGRILAVNRPFQDTLGLGFEALAGMQAADLHADPADWKKLAAAVERDGAVAGMETRLKRDDGTPLWVLTSCRATGLDGTRVLLSVLQDITGRKDAELAMETRERRLRRIADALPAMVYLMDERGRSTFVNRPTLEYTGRSFDDMQGDGWQEVVHPEDRPGLLETMRRAAREGKPFEHEYRALTAEGGYGWRLNRGRPLRDRHGRHRSIIGVCLDNTETKRIEAELRRAKEAAERADDAKSRFLAAASHDLRQPLNAMSLLLGVLRAQITDPRATAVATQMQQSLDAMVELFNALLDVSRLDMGAARIRHEPVDAAALFARIETDFRAAAASKGLELRIVPSGATLWSDPALLERALRNLVSNAIRYTERGRVLLGCRRRGTATRIEVHDSGPGIPADRLDDIFEEFYQVGNPARERREGHGLGLSIVRRAMDLLGHRLEVISSVGRGSRFAIEAPSWPAAGEGPPPASEEGGPGLAVLLIEDDPLVQSAMRLTLEELGCHVLAAPSLAEALAALDAGDAAPHLVLADYRLPGGADGLCAITTLRARLGPGFSACVLTGDLQADIQAQVEAAGARFLRKPIRPDDIRSIVEAARHAARWRRPAKPAA